MLCVSGECHQQLTPPTTSVCMRMYKETYCAQTPPCVDVCIKCTGTHLRHTRRCVHALNANRYTQEAIFCVCTDIRSSPHIKNRNYPVLIHTRPSPRVKTLSTRNPLRRRQQPTGTRDAYTIGSIPISQEDDTMLRVCCAVQQRTHVVAWLRSDEKTGFIAGGEVRFVSGAQDRQECMHASQACSCIILSPLESSGVEPAPTAETAHR